MYAGRGLQATDHLVAQRQRGPPPPKHVGNSSSREYICDSAEFWIPYFGKALLIGTDPEGAFLSEEWKRFCGEYRMEASVQPSEAHWRIANVERTIGIIQNFRMWLDRQRCLPRRTSRSSPR